MMSEESTIKRVQFYLDKIDNAYNLEIEQAKAKYLQLVDDAEFNKEIRLHQMGFIEKPVTYLQSYSATRNIQKLQNKTRKCWNGFVNNTWTG